MTLFDFNDYRNYLRETLAQLPKRGHGQAKKLAAHLGVSTTLISQILNEQKHFTLDQAHLATEFLAMTDLEARFFLCLVQIERAASASYRRSLEKDLQRYKEQSLKLEERLTHKQILSDEQKAIFYSDWYFSAIRVLTSIDGVDTLELIAQYLGLPKKLVSDTLQFLETTQLILKDNGKYKIGPLSTHVGADSPWVRLHHENWRNKAIEFMNYPDTQKLHYTSPMTLNLRDVEKIRGKLIQMIDEVGRIVDDSPAQQIRCLNIDWFQIPPRLP